MAQHHIIRLLLHDAIQFETASLINKNAWPEFQQRDSYRQQVLLAAATRKVEVDGMKDIKCRLVADPDFGQQLGNTVCTSSIMTHLQKCYGNMFYRFLIVLPMFVVLSSCKDLHKLPSTN